MQFPQIPSLPPAATARTDVAPVQPARPLTAIEGGTPAASDSSVHAQGAPQPNPDAPPRRQQPSRRSGADRRQRNAPVLLDTRSGRDRRVRRRRAEDPPPSGVDLSA
jgi:hypothetical protein